VEELLTILVGSDEAWRRYETRTFKVTVTDEAGAAVNLTGVSLEWHLTASQNDTATALLHKAAGEFGALEGASNNIAVWTVTDTQSASIPAGFYWMELWDRSNDVCLLAGNVVLQPGRAPVP